MKKSCIFVRVIKNINSTRSLYKDYTTLVKVLHEAGTSTTRSWYKYYTKLVQGGFKGWYKEDTTVNKDKINSIN